jgi:hypothetical protein
MEKFVYVFNPPMVEQLPALYPEIPGFMFISRSNGLTRPNNDLHLSHRIWFSRDQTEKSFQDGCAMIGQLSAKLVLRRAKFVHEFFPDCYSNEFDQVASILPFITLPEPDDLRSDAEKVSYASTQAFLEDSETYIPEDGFILEDAAWYMRVNACVLQRVYKSKHLPEGDKKT